MIPRFLGALQFLTILPIRQSTASPGESAVFFPLVGALLGAGAGLICPYSPLFAIVALVSATGCLHEDGLADVADALRAGRTRERMLAILKDSRIGTYGAIALIVSFAARWQALAQGVAAPVLSLASAVALSRGSMVVLAALSPAVGEGLGREFVSQLSQGVLLLVLVQMGAALWFLGWQCSVAAAAVFFMARWYFLRRLGGVNGDCLGAACQAVEVACFTALSWRHSS